MKNKIFVILFLGVLYTIFFANIIKPASELSFSERRRLTQFPELSLKTVMDASAMQNFDKYAVDQIVFREQFRRLKALFDLDVLRKSDNNGIFKINNMVFKTEYPINENSVQRIGRRINDMYDKFLTDKINVYFAMIPDKNYYIKNPVNLIMDYRQIESLMLGNLKEEIKYISLFESLSLDCYYATDSHWRQEKLSDVISALGKGLDIDFKFDLNNYGQISFNPFYGVYYGQSALNVAPDELIYLVNDSVGNAEVKILSDKALFEDSIMYKTDSLGGMDSYDLFLSGAAPIIVINNPSNDSGRELIIFRDSYASSLAPLLLDGYSSVTLIDIRYISPDIIGNFVEFKDGQDVLFLYSSTIINNSGSIR